MSIATALAADFALITLGFALVIGPRGVTIATSLLFAATPTATAAHVLAAS